MRKVLLLALILVIMIITALYFSVPKETIVVDSETDTTFKELNPDFVSSKTFIINYTIGDSTDKYSLQKTLFEDAYSAEKYKNHFSDSTTNVHVNRSAVKIGEFEGYTFDNLDMKDGRITSVGLLLMREETLLYGYGREKESLIKVTKWFIERY